MKNKHRRINGLVWGIVIALFLSNFPSAAFATSVEYIETAVPLIQEGAFDLLPDPQVSSSRGVTIQDVIIEALENVEAEINLSSFGIDRNDISAIYGSVINSNPQFFYVSSTHSISYSYYDYKVISITPYYSEPKEIILPKKQALSNEVEKLIASIPVGVSEAEQVLAVNDYMVVNTEFNTSGNNLNRHNTYGALVDKSAVCQGYSLAFGLIMNRLGIKWQYVSSSEMDHGWNIVQLDDKWYHVDVTWNDPTCRREDEFPDQLGFVRHEYLLISDDVISDTIHRHSGWPINTPVANDNTYKDYFWTNVRSEIIHYDGKWYYIQGNTWLNFYIQAYDFPTGVISNVYRITARWSSGASSYWQIASKLARYKNKLYYNTSDKIFSINFDGTDNREFLSETLSGTDAIYEMRIQDNYLQYRILYEPQAPGAVQKTVLLEEKTVSLKGATQSYNAQDFATVQLTQNDKVVYTTYTTTIEGTTGFGMIRQEFTFPEVAPGTYSLVVTKPGHTSYTVRNVIVADDDIDLVQDSRPEVSLMTLRCGDINGDGLINDVDLTVLWTLGNYNRKAEGIADSRCDLNGDGMINDKDLTILWRVENYNKGEVLIESAAILRNLFWGSSL